MADENPGSEKYGKLVKLGERAVETAKRYAEDEGKADPADQDDAEVDTAGTKDAEMVDD